MRLMMVLYVMGGVLLFLMVTGCSRLLPGGVSHPVGAAARAGSYIVTIMSTQEGRVPSLHGDPENDRFRLSLMLHPVDGGSPTTIALGEGLRAADYLHGARILGDDGERVWFHAHEMMAYDYRAHRLLRKEQLPKQAEPRRSPAFGRHEAKDFLEPDAAAGLKKAAWILDQAHGKPLLLNESGDRLRMHRSNQGIFGAVVVSRVDRSGSVLWSVDTNLLDLDEVLPDRKHLALVGRFMPAQPDEVRGPNLLLIDTGTGAKHQRSLWLR